MTLRYQRPLFPQDQPVADVAAAFLHKLDPTPAPVAELLPWVWLSGDAVRVCCEPTLYPDPPAWQLSAWERVTDGRYSGGYREAGRFGRVDLRWPPTQLEVGVRRIRDIREAAETAESDARARHLEALAQTQRGVMQLWREDLLANVAEALTTIRTAVPAAALGTVDHGTIVVDLDDYTPPVADPAHWHLLQGRLRRYDTEAWLAARAAEEAHR